VEKVDDVEHRGVARESHCCIEGQWGGKATTLSPMVVVEEQERISSIKIFCYSGLVFTIGMIPVQNFNALCKCGILLLGRTLNMVTRAILCLIRFVVYVFGAFG
jgi:hypothetical protein